MVVGFHSRSGGVGDSHFRHSHIILSAVNVRKVIKRGKKERYIHAAAAAI